MWDSCPEWMMSLALHPVDCFALRFERRENVIATRLDSIIIALDRPEQGSVRQQQFTETVAHELRTPLTILRTRIDMLADPDVARILRKDVQGMSRVARSYWNLREVETLTPAAEVTDLQAVAAEVVEALGPLAIAEKKSLALTGTEDRVVRALIGHLRDFLVRH
jgi:signal transduction histidine kinase